MSARPVAAGGWAEAVKNICGVCLRTCCGWALPQPRSGDEFVGTVSQGSPEGLRGKRWANGFESRWMVLRNSFSQVVDPLAKTHIGALLLRQQMLRADKHPKRADVNAVASFFNFTATSSKLIRPKQSAHSLFFGLCSATTGTCSEFRNTLRWDSRTTRTSEPISLTDKRPHLPSSKISETRRNLSSTSAFQNSTIPKSRRFLAPAYWLKSSIYAS